jgi:membrane protease YdiL (CAAX protease family)
MNDVSTNRSPLKFFLIVYALSVPLWIIETMVEVKGLPDNLPITDVAATFVPLIAAALLVHREEKWVGVKKLLMRAFDYKKIKKKAWYIVILFLMPLLYILTYLVMRIIGLPLPVEWHIPSQVPLLFIAFFFAAAGEELGYTGYAVDPLQSRWNALTAGLIAGSIWAIWHLPSMIKMDQTPMLMVNGFIVTVAFRVLYVWLYNNTGKSVFAVILLHAIGNTGRSVFPGGRNNFELADAAVGYYIIAITAIMVILLWGPKTLARFNGRT